MKRRIFVGGALSGAGLAAKPPKAKAGGIPMKEFGRTGVKVTIIAQGGARMDLTAPTAIGAVRASRPTASASARMCFSLRNPPNAARPRPKPNCISPLSA